MASTASDSKAATGCPVDHGKFSMPGASLADPAIIANPGDYYMAMRREDPVHYDEKIGMWLVSRYEDLMTVLRDPVTYSLDRGFREIYAAGHFEEFKEILERDGGGFFPDAIASDPPYHTQVRRLMEKAFTAHRVKELEPRIEGVVGALIDKFADKGRADAINDFAVPMTIAIICEQLGLDHVGSEKIQRWSQAVTAQIGKLQDREQVLQNARDVCDLQNYLIAHIHDREQTPREDMISDLVHAGEDAETGAILTFKEVVSLVRALLIAGNETTATALGSLFFNLATKPEFARQLKEVAEDERQLGRFCEEFVRFEPPVRGLTRMTIKEVDLNGTLLPEGAHMLLLYGSGNDDETEFACPREFDMTRPNLGRHIAFGAGPHKCVGIALARMEIRVAAREVVRRLKDIKLDIPVDQIEFLPTVATRSMMSLPITFSRRD